MSAIAAILLGLAGDLAVPMIKKVLTDQFGKPGELAGSAIDIIAEKAGVIPSSLPTTAEHEPDRVREAMIAAEPETAALLAHWIESQRMANELQIAEMSKEQTWTWAWRPAWMYLIGLFWIWLVIAVPLANALTGANITTIDAATLMALTGAYLALYMGGHTVKDLMTKWKNG